MFMSFLQLILKPKLGKNYNFSFEYPQRFLAGSVIPQHQPWLLPSCAENSTKDLQEEEELGNNSLSFESVASSFYTGDWEGVSDWWQPCSLCTYVTALHADEKGLVLVEQGHSAAFLLLMEIARSCRCCSLLPWCLDKKHATNYRLGMRCGHSPPVYLAALAALKFSNWMRKVCSMRHLKIRKFCRGISGT